MSRFPAAFRLPAFASRSSDSRRGIGPSLRLAYRAKDPDPDRVTAFHTHELRPGWVPPLPQGRRCSTRLESSPQPAPAAFQRPVPHTPLRLPIGGASFHEASTGVHAILRVSPAHCCAGLPSEPDERLSPHPAQASPRESRADRSAGPLPRPASCWSWQWVCMRRVSVLSDVPSARMAT
jgi:hypothetical protein